MKYSFSSSSTAIQSYDLFAIIQDVEPKVIAILLDFAVKYIFEKLPKTFPPKIWELFYACAKFIYWFCK